MGGFVGTQLHVDTAHKVNDIGKLGEVHFNIAVHPDTEIGFQGFVQQLHAAGGIGHVDPVVLVSGDRHIQVPQDGGHDQGFRFLVIGAQDHGIGSGPVFPRPPVLADQQDVDESAAFSADQSIRLPQLHILRIHIGVACLGFSGQQLLQLLVGQGGAILRVHILDLIHQILNIYGNCQHGCQDKPQHGAQQLQQKALKPQLSASFGFAHENTSDNR